MSAAYLVVALACFIALYYAFKLWRQNPEPTTLLILVPILFLWLDNFAIATGKWVGEGAVLTGMTYLRFYWHWQMLPLLIIVAGALARRAGFGWAQSKYVMGAFCLVAVFLFPSTTDTFGNVILEALASGVPCIVSDQGGPKDLIMHGKTGLITRARDVEDFTNAVARLVGDTALRETMRTEAHRAVQDRDWAEAGRRFWTSGE